jgi:IS30 family transposase
MSHYQHLTINDHEMILKGLAQSKTIREIAQKLKRAPSTNSREIKRHKSGNTGRYSPEGISQRSLLETGEAIISFITIYCGIYAGLFDKPGLSQENRGAIRKLRH